MDLDLHMHSRMSDGTLSPEAVVDAAADAHLDVISLTDHDTVAGVRRAQAHAQGRDLEVIPGIEVSASWDEGEIHILGYFIDPDHPRMQEHGSWAAGRRRERMEAMVTGLQAQGVDVTMDDVLTQAGDDMGSLARPHLARALEANGVVTSASDAFVHWIGNEHEAFVPTRLLSPEDTIELIAEAGGVSVWAHPRESSIDDLLPGLVRAGLDGLEVYRPNHSRDRTRRLEGRARSAGLLVTGGSDWHGPERGELGEFRVQSREVAAFLEVGGL